VFCRKKESQVWNGYSFNNIVFPIILAWITRSFPEITWSQKVDSFFAHGASGKISQRAHIHHNSNTSCLESIAGKSGSPQHYVMGSLLSWQRCGNWTICAVGGCGVCWQNVPRIGFLDGFGFKHSVREFPLWHNSGFGVLCTYYVFGHIHLFFIFPQDLEEVLYCILKKGSISGQIDLAKTMTGHFVSPEVFILRSFYILITLIKPIQCTSDELVLCLYFVIW